MPDEFEEQEWLKFGVAAALSKQYGADQRAFLDLLAAMLERAMPEEAEVVKRGGMFSKRTVAKVIVTFGDNRYLLEDPGHGPLLAWRTRIVRGIAIKTEPIPVETWLEELSSNLDDRARTSATAREALARMIG